MRWSRILVLVGVMVLSGSAPTVTAQAETDAPGGSPDGAPILTGSFGWVAVTHDPNGIGHLVAATDVAGFDAGGDLWYATDRSGSWLGERIAEGRGCNGSWTNPDLAADADGSIHIVATLGLPCDTPAGSRGIYHLTDRGREPGVFGASIRVSRRGVDWPSIEVDEGVVSLAYARVPIPREPSPVTLATDRDGEWRTQRLAETGSTPSLRLDAEGRAHVVFSDRRGLRYLVRASDGGSLSGPTRITPADDRPGRASLDLDAAGQPAVAWVRPTDLGGDLFWSRSTPSGWQEPESLGSAIVADLAFDASRRPHIAIVTTDSEGSSVNHGVLDGETWTWTTLATADDLKGVAVDASGTTTTVAWAGEVDGSRGLWVRTNDEPPAS